MLEWQLLQTWNFPGHHVRVIDILGFEPRACSCPANVSQHSVAKLHLHTSLIYPGVCSQSIDSRCSQRPSLHVEPPFQEASQQGGEVKTALHNGNVQGSTPGHFYPHFIGHTGLLWPPHLTSRKAQLQKTNATGLALSSIFMKDSVFGKTSNILRHACITEKFLETDLSQEKF